MDLSSIHKIHFIAICGTGMGSLAITLKQRGFEISGSDQNIYPPMSDRLNHHQIKIFPQYSEENISKVKPDLVIIGNAISKDNIEAQKVLEAPIPYLSMAEAIGQFLIEQRKSIVISGTHGKTTTTSLMSFAFHQLKLNPSYLIGGVLQNDFPSQVYQAGEYFVIEGDEYDTAFFDKGPKFLHYKPYHTIITSIEFDHADIYQNIEAIKKSFEKLIQQTHPQGSIIYCHHYPHLQDLIHDTHKNFLSYGIDQGDFQARNLNPNQQGIHFDFYHQEKYLGKIYSSLLGEHNVQNTLAVITLLYQMGFSIDEMNQAIKDFPGIKRRQEIRACINNKIVIDDFAHHPTAIQETLKAIRSSYQGFEIWGIFEPRSNTSMRDTFQKEFSESFDHADYVIIADVFNPQKIKSGSILDTKRLVNDLNKNKEKAYHLSGTENIINHLIKQASTKAIFVIMSNGGFDNIHQKLIDKL